MSYGREASPSGGTGRGCRVDALDDFAHKDSLSGSLTSKVDPSRLYILLSMLSHCSSARGSRALPFLGQSPRGDRHGFICDSPRANRGTKQCASWSRSPHSRATLTAVRMLSPVTITALIQESCNSLSTAAVVGFSLFSKMMKPIKSRLLSTADRPIFCALTQLSFGRCLVAQPMTRYPLWV